MRTFLILDKIFNLTKHIVLFIVIAPRDFGRGFVQEVLYKIGLTSAHAHVVDIVIS